ncbi:MAG: DegT/DnrJ/EryC1/StrS family aminotransferase [Bacteroidales bacterium]|nr:DegT/DnrJ/EryC1/StrS family aminotransferase [Bacteroidales bacterium]
MTALQIIPFSPPRIDQKIIDAVTETLKSGWITTGPKTKVFEKMLTAYGGHQSTLCLNSASAGLELILRWLGVGPGDEVIVPAYTYAATANVVIHCGARPIFVDSGEDLNIDIRSVRKAITTRTKVIMPVDIAGLPCDYDALNALIREAEILKIFSPSSEPQSQLGRILLLSDAAHSLGGWYKGNRVGSLADVTVYSFHAVKNLTTAEGGAVCLNLPLPFNNEDVYMHLNAKSLHGQNKDALAKFQVGNWRYDIIEAGYKCNMTDIQAAMGIVELERYDDDMLPARQQIFTHYTSLFEGKKWAQLPEYESSDRRSSYHVFALRIHNITEMQRDDIIQAIFGSGVSVNVHFVPLPMMSFYKEQGWDMAQFPVAYDNYSREISLPVYYDLNADLVERVARTVINAVEEILDRK